MEFMKRNGAFVIKLDELAKEIGNEPVTLPTGQTRINWDKDTAQAACKEVKDLSSTGEKVVIDGAAPGWFVAALTHAVHPCPVALHDPKLATDIDIPRLPTGEPNPEGGISFELTEGVDGILVEWKITDPNGVYDVNNLSKIVAPEIPEGKVVALSGRGPNYITVALGEAYAHVSRGVVYNQPGVGFTCGITHSPGGEIGDVFSPEDVQQDIDDFQASNPNIGDNSSNIDDSNDEQTP